MADGGARNYRRQAGTRAPSVFDRQLKALVKLRKTKSGRKLVADHREAFLDLLAAGAARDAKERNR
jgi:hypothetical protein